MILRGNPESGAKGIVDRLRHICAVLLIVRVGMHAQHLEKVIAPARLSFVGMGKMVAIGLPSARLLIVKARVGIVLRHRTFEKVTVPLQSCNARPSVGK